MVDIANYKGNYRGIMFVALSIDANKQIYPLAFGLGIRRMTNCGRGL